MENSDAQIIAAYQASGLASELAELVSRNIGRVRALAYQMTLDHAAADDITQEVFLKVMHGLKSFRGEAKFSTWLYRITMNAAHLHLRRTRPTVAADDRRVVELKDRAAGPDERFAQYETLVELDRVLRELTPALRAAIALTVLERLSPSEAAAIEGCSTATMYWRVHQARKQLKKKLERHFER